MTDRNKHQAQTRDSRLAVTGAVLAASFAAAAAIGSAVPAGLGLTFALWQALRAQQAAPAPAPVHARSARRR